MAIKITKNGISRIYFTDVVLLTDDNTTIRLECSDSNNHKVSVTLTKTDILRILKKALISGIIDKGYAYKKVE